MNSKLPIKCNLPDGFLNEEIRSGFVVSGKLKAVWAVELDLLEEFMRICAKYGIKYQIFGGSLLGAIRHKGYIPWDDDLDIALTREEYRRFLEVAPKELKEPYFLQTALSDRMFFFGTARLRNSLTTGVIDWFDRPEYNNGIYIDLYVLDGQAMTWWQNFFRSKLKWFAEKLLMASTYLGKASWSKRLFYNMIRPFASLFSYETRYAFYERQLMRYNKDAAILSQVTHGDYTYKYRIRKEHWESTTMVPFEWLMVPAPADYDSVLKGIYGDYKKLPPIEVRGKWHEGLVHFEPMKPYTQYFKERNVHG